MERLKEWKHCIHLENELVLKSIVWNVWKACPAHASFLGMASMFPFKAFVSRDFWPPSHSFMGTWSKISQLDYLSPWYWGQKTNTEQKILRMEP